MAVNSSQLGALRLPHPMLQGEGEGEKHRSGSMWMG